MPYRTQFLQNSKSTRNSTERSYALQFQTRTEKLSRIAFVEGIGKTQERILNARYQIIWDRPKQNKP